MPADGSTFQAWTAPTPWSSLADLTADQAERYGDYVAAKDQVRQTAAFTAEQRGKAQKALSITGGDKAAAFELMMAGRV